jgi:sugar lactone lactonase YvrE
MLALVLISSSMAQNAAVAPGTPNAPLLPYRFMPRPAPPNGEAFGNVSAVALTPQGNLLVLNRNPAIMMVEYNPAGTQVLRTFNPNMAQMAHGMRVDRHGNIWVTDSFLNLVWKLNARGEVLMMLGKRGENGAWDDTKWNGMFNQPLDVAFDARDNFYVVQSHGGTSFPADCTFCVNYAAGLNANSKAVAAKPPVPPGSDARVMKFDAKGNLLASASLAPASGPYPTTHSVVVAPNGEVWVADRQVKKIVVFDSNLKKLREIPQDYLVCGFFVDSQNGLWAVTGRDGMVLKLDWNGKILGYIGRPAATPDPNSNDIGEAHYLTVSKDLRTIYVADSTQARVHKLVRN